MQQVAHEVKAILDERQHENTSVNQCIIPKTAKNTAAFYPI